MPKIVKGTETNKWLPPHWRKSTFPILKQPAKTFDDIDGSAFLLQYKERPYIVTASHVIETENPIIAFSTKNQQVIPISSSNFEEMGLSWVKHPAGIDLAAIPFLLPLSVLKKLDLFYITEEKWSPQALFKINDDVAHLGYPEKGTSNYADGTRSLFPQSMPGKIIQIKSQHMIMETAGTYGASGGPVFLNRNQTPFLIGVVTEEKMYGLRTRPEEAVPCNKTKFLAVSLLKDILEGKEIEEQIHRFGEKLFELYKNTKPT